MCSNKFLFTLCFFCSCIRVYWLFFSPQHETLKVQLAMEHLAVIARQHHRSRQTAGFMISTALPVFCRCILQNPDALAIDRTEKNFEPHLGFQHVFVSFSTLTYLCYKYLCLQVFDVFFDRISDINMLSVYQWVWSESRLGRGRQEILGTRWFVFTAANCCVIFFYLRITMRRQRFCFTRSEFTYTLGGAQNMKNSSGWETYDISLISNIYTWMFSYICKSSTKTEVLKGYI